MNRIKAWVIGIFACHILIASSKLSADDADNTVKISAMITIGLPLIVLYIAVVALLSGILSTEKIKVLSVVAAVTTIFGVSGATDKIHDRNLVEIRNRAAEIRSNPEQGVAWARRRIFKIYGGNAVAMILIIVLI